MALRSRRGLPEYEDHMTAMYNKHFKTDRECAASLQSRLRYMPATHVKLATFRQLVKTYYEDKQEGLQVQTESEVAAKMLGKLNIKTPSSGWQGSTC